MLVFSCYNHSSGSLKTFLFETLDECEKFVDSYIEEITNANKFIKYTFSFQKY